MGPALPIPSILRIIFRPLLWSWSNLFLFNLHNQRHPQSIREDAVNKPWRPIPSGRITSVQTTRVMYCMYPVTSVIALGTGGLVPCLVETLLCIWYNELGGAANPFLKNALNGFGFACFLAGPFEVVTRRSIFTGDNKAAIWLLILAIAITSSSHLQDFRDTAGDKAMGRKTVPIVMGDLAARLQCSVALLVSTGVACCFWRVSCGQGVIAEISGLTIAANLLLHRNRSGDILSWRLFPLWMLGLILLPVLSAFRN
ncbi:UbiA prenyltransferase family [Xylaria venustula]|nr:UbiA prenyltransferase family [Xylaria venustula]